MRTTRWLGVQFQDRISRLALLIAADSTALLAWTIYLVRLDISQTGGPSGLMWLCVVAIVACAVIGIYLAMQMMTALGIRKEPQAGAGVARRITQTFF